MTGPETRPGFTQMQVELAEGGLAVGQCQSCGSYRADGLPPVLHRSGCPEANPYGHTAAQTDDGDDAASQPHSAT